LAEEGRGRRIRRKNDIPSEYTGGISGGISKMIFPVNTLEVYLEAYLK
jgi:hypothetical protein